MNSAFFLTHLVLLNLCECLLLSLILKLFGNEQMLEPSLLRNPAKLQLISLILLNILMAEMQHFRDVNQALLDGELAEFPFLELGLDDLFPLPHCAGGITLHNQLRVNSGFLQSSAQRA